MINTKCLKGHFPDKPWLSGCPLGSLPKLPFGTNRNYIYYTIQLGFLRLNHHTSLDPDQYHLCNVIYIFISSKRQPNIIINTLKTLKY